MQDTKSITSFSLTCADAPKPLTTTPTPFYDANFHVTTHPAYYGDGLRQQSPATVGSVITFQNGNLADIFFKNYTAGSNSVIECVATVPLTWVKQKLGMI
jgi:hypothetical protein